MACNDDRARMLTEICLMQGIHVPADVAILGVDNDEEVCKSAHPPISSIALATERAGYQMAAMLERVISGMTPSSRVTTISPTYLVPRRSTEILSIKDVHVSRAVVFIRANVSRRIAVSELEEVAGLSRRSLQDAFLRSLGRTPLEEIHNARSERISRLLIETDLPIAKIAEVSGFEIDSHLGPILFPTLRYDAAGLSQEIQKLVGERFQKSGELPDLVISVPNLDWISGARSGYADGCSVFTGLK